jgi:hypothetical protein
MADDDLEGIPTGRPSGGAVMCPDCFCPPHRLIAKGRDRECPHCGCPSFIDAKRERDGEGIANHFPGGERNSTPGFAPDGGRGIGIG